MGFRIFVLTISALIPGIMIIFGRLFIRHAPQDINYIFGYRTSRSMKNMETWEFAHRYIGRIWFRWGWGMLGASLAVTLSALGQSNDTLGTVCSVMTSIQLFPLFGSILSTEIALRRTFDGTGARR